MNERRIKRDSFVSRVSLAVQGVGSESSSPSLSSGHDGAPLPTPPPIVVVVALNGAAIRRGSIVGATVTRAVSETASKTMGALFPASAATAFAIAPPAPPYPVTAAADGSGMAKAVPGMPDTAWPIIATLASVP